MLAPEEEEKKASSKLKGMHRHAVTCLPGFTAAIAPPPPLQVANCCVCYIPNIIILILLGNSQAEISPSAVAEEFQSFSRFLHSWPFCIGFVNTRFRFITYWRNFSSSSFFLHMADRVAKAAEAPVGLITRPGVSPRSQYNFKNYPIFYSITV